MTTWPTCTRCQRSIMWHELRGQKALCANSSTPGDFTVTQVNEVRRVLGHHLTETAIQQEAEERQIAGQEKMKLA